METTQSPKTDRELLEEIQENSRKTKNYMKWQLIITVALVVIPLLATIVVVPFVFSSLSSVYGTGSLDDGSALNSVQQLTQ